RGGRRATLTLEVWLHLFFGSLRSPGFLAVGASIGNRVQLPTIEGSEDEIIAGDDWRGEPAGDSHTPFHVGDRPEFHGRRLIVGNARTVRPTEPRPSQLRFRAQTGGSEPAHCHDHDQVLHVRFLACQNACYSTELGA